MTSFVERIIDDKIVKKETWVVLYFTDNKQYTEYFDNLTRAQIYYYELQALGHEPRIFPQIFH